MFSKIVIASDGSEGAHRALSAAIRLAKKHDAELHLVSVEELPQFPASVDEVVEEKTATNHFYEGVAARARAQAQAERVKFVSHLLSGHAVRTIVEFVRREQADLLVVGYMGHSAVYNRIIGSTTDRLVELAPSAVLVIK